MRITFRLVLSLLIFMSTLSHAHEVGFRKMEVSSSETNDSFPMVLFYPTSSKPKLVEIGPFKMNIAIGGNISAGKFPLIMVSHGSGGSNLSYKDIAVSLAANGFMVAIPLHPKNNYMDNSLEGSLANYINRPKHITSALDMLLGTPGLNSHVDSNKVAVLGHSVGGYTALATAGGIANTGSLISLCRSKPSLSDPYCGPVREGTITQEIINNTKDNRIKALILMAPVSVLFSAKGSLTEIDIPILLLRAEKDEELTEPYNCKLIEKNIVDRGKLTSITIANAGHYSFLTPFPESLKSELGTIAQDPAGFDREEFQNTLGFLIIDYLNSTLGRSRR